MVNAILDFLLVGYVSGTRDSKISHAQNMRLVDDADGDDEKQSGTNKKQGMEFCKAICNRSDGSKGIG